MRTITLHGGRELLVPETPEDWLSLQPEAKLRALFAGDEAATLRFHDRMRDLAARFDAWPGRNAWIERTRADWLRRFA